MLDDTNDTSPAPDVGADIGSDFDLDANENVGADIGACPESEARENSEVGPADGGTPDSEVGEHVLEVPPAEAGSSAFADNLKSSSFKGAAVSAAALSVMGWSSLAHPQKAGEVAALVEPTPVVQEVDPVESTINLVEVDQGQEASEEVIESQDQTKAETEEQQTPAKVESHIETALIEEQWWMDVPSKSQQDLTYNGGTTQYGCAPTATSMVLDYWHAQDSANQTMSAQDLLNVNAEQGEFKSRGMSITNVHDEVQRLGYGVVEDYVDSDLDTLKEEVANGPVIASVKLNMKPSGENHSVVVTGISQDNQVRVNDPWTGEMHTHSWEAFSRSWGADFGTGTRNHFSVIRPS